VGLPERERPPVRWTAPRYEVDSRGKVLGATPPRANNWGRFGDEDERGTANLITRDSVVQAAGLVRTGQCVSLALPIDPAGPTLPNRPPPLRLNLVTGSDYLASHEAPGADAALEWTDDLIVMPLQGSTQWDGLAHIVRDGSLYNGWWSGMVTASQGATRNGIEHLAESLVGRGVLLDVCAHRGGAPLAAGEAITPDELDAVAAAERVELRSGDIVLIRTGYLGVLYDTIGDPEAQRAWFCGEPGLTAGCVEWCQSHDIAALAVDNYGIEVDPGESGQEKFYPFHQSAIPGLGLTCGEMFWLDDLAEACAAEGRHEFFLAAQPLRIVNGSGSMLNPIAVL